MNWAGLGNSFQLFVGYFLLAVVCTIAAVRTAKPGWRKWAAGLGTFGVFWSLTLIDDIMGARERGALCQTEAGVKIYKQAKLPSEFYLPDGRPKFINEEGGIKIVRSKKLWLVTSNSNGRGKIPTRIAILKSIRMFVRSST